MYAEKSIDTADKAYYAEKRKDKPNMRMKIM